MFHIVGHGLVTSGSPSMRRASSAPSMPRSTSATLAPRNGLPAYDFGKASE